MNLTVEWLSRLHAVSVYIQMKAQSASSNSCVSAVNGFAYFVGV